MSAAPLSPLQQEMFCEALHCWLACSTVRLDGIDWRGASTTEAKVRTAKIKTAILESISIPDVAPKKIYKGSGVRKEDRRPINSRIYYKVSRVDNVSSRAEFEDLIYALEMSSGDHLFVFLCLLTRNPRPSVLMILISWYYVESERFMLAVCVEAYTQFWLAALCPLTTSLAFGAHLCIAVRHGVYPVKNSIREPEMAV